MKAEGVKLRNNNYNWYGHSASLKIVGIFNCNLNII